MVLLIMDYLEDPDWSGFCGFELEEGLFFSSCSGEPGSSSRILVERSER